MNYWFLEKRLLCIKTASSFPSLFGNDIVSVPGVSTPLVSISRLASLWVGYSDSCLLENWTSLLLRLWNCYYCNQTPRNTPCCLTNSLWVSSVVSGVTSLPNHADGFTKDSWKDAILFFPSRQDVKRYTFVNFAKYHQKVIEYGFPIQLYIIWDEVVGALHFNFNWKSHTMSQTTWTKTNNQHQRKRNPVLHPK